MRFAFLAACLAAACGGLSAVDKGGLHDAATLSAMGYAHQDAGTPGAALDRGAFCAVAGILRRQALPIPDGGIECSK